MPIGFGTEAHRKVEKMRKMVLSATGALALFVPSSLAAQAQTQATLADFEKKVQLEYTYGLFTVPVAGEVVSAPLLSSDLRFKSSQEMVASCFEEVKVTLLGREYQRQDPTLTAADALKAAAEVPAKQRNTVKITYDVQDDLKAAVDFFGECATSKIETLQVVNGRRVVISLATRKNPRVGIVYGAVAERAKARMPGQTR